MNELEIFYEKIFSLTNILNKNEESAVSAGFYDILEGIEKIKLLMKKIVDSNKKEEISDFLFEIHFELMHHIKLHIESMQVPFIIKTIRIN